MALWTSLIAWAVFLLLLLVFLNIDLGTRRRPPGPRPWPVVGNLLHLGGQTSPQSLVRLSKRYGPIMFLRLGSVPAVVVSNAHFAKEFLTSCDKTFASRPPSEVVRRLHYGPDSGLSTAIYGSYWRNMRRICSLQLFTATRVRQFEPVRKEEIKLMIKDLADEAQQNTRLVDLGMAISNLTESIMGRILFGKRLFEVTDERLGASLKSVIHETSGVFQATVIGDFTPYLRWLDVKIKRRMDRLHNAYDILLESVLSGRRQSVLAENEQGDNMKDLVDVLLSNDLAKHQLKGLVQDLIGAGTRTTAVTLEWAIAELLRHPRTLRKLQEELDAAVGRHRMVEESDLTDLPYLKAVVKETLRLHPPLPLLIPHMSTEACTVEGYDLPKGTRLIVNAWAINRDPELWEEPEEFKPDRFIGKNIDIRGQNFELLPFGAGRRSCPGLPLAMTLLEVAVANLAHCFDWEDPPAGQALDVSSQVPRKPGPPANRAVPKPRLLSQTSF